MLPRSRSWRGILMPDYVGNCTQWTKTRRRWQALKRNAFKFVKPRLWQDMARCVRSLVCSHILFVLSYVCSLIHSFTCLCIDLFVNRSPVCSCLSVRSFPLRSILDLVMPCPYEVEMCQTGTYGRTKALSRAFQDGDETKQDGSFTSIST